MSRTSKSSKQKKAIQQIRQKIADVIIGNQAHTVPHSSDIHHASHMAELCDEYTLLLFLNWLGTRCGFPIYPSAIRSDIDKDLLPFLSWPSLANRYPFHSYEKQIFPRDSIRELFDLFDEQFPSKPELVGDLYQQLIAKPLAISKGKMVGAVSSEDERTVGEFYTPDWLTDLAFSYWTESLEDDKRGSQNISFSIYDPSCGCGNFLLAAIRAQGAKAQSAKALDTFVKDDIYGADLDGKAVSIARVLILLQYCLVANELNFDLNIEDIANSLLKSVIVRDSLAESLAALQSEERKFDLVITNPPYISFGSRDQSKLPSSWQKFLKNRFPASSEYKIRLTSVFQEIGLSLLKPGGQGIFLIPDAFLTGGYYQRLRELLLRNAQIVSLTELPEKTFSDVTVGRWCLAQYKLPIDISGREISRLGPTIVRTIDFNEPEKIESNEYRLSRSTLVSKDKSRFQLIFSRIDEAIVNKCADMPYLSSLILGHTGIRARAGQKSIIRTSSRGQLDQPGITSGSEVSQYKISWSGNFLCIDAKNLFAGGFAPEIIKNPKILVRQTGDRIIAAVDLSGLYHLNNVHSFSKFGLTQREATKADYQISKLDQLVCLLNSSFYRYFYGLKTREQKKALAQIDIETVEHLPIPMRFETDGCELEDLGLQIRENLRKIDSSTSSNLALQESLEKVDLIVFELFELSKTEKLHIQESVSKYAGKVP